MASNAVRRVRLAIITASVMGVATPWSIVPANAQRVAAEVATPNESKRVTLDIDNAPLAQAIHAIAEQAGLTPIFNDAVIPARARVSLHVRDVPVGQAFQQALQGTGLVARVREEGNVAIVRDQVSVADGTVTGTVTHAKTKKPIAGATVQIGDSQKGAVTDADGAFRLVLPPGEYVLRVRGIGFVRQAKTIVVADGQTQAVQFAMEPSASVLDEVVVTGTVVETERKAIPTPITVITADELQKLGVTRLDQIFRGMVPGVIALERGAGMYTVNELGAAATTKVYSRGASRTDGQASPLKTYIDGVEMLDPSYLGTIDPQSIEKIEIITGPQAATIYGSGAMGGVMQIFTKKGSGQSTLNLTLGVKYGMLESNFSNGRAPSHTDVLSMDGGSGPTLSYAGTLSHNYIGQWQPALFSRALGGSLGLTHTRGPATVSASLSATTGKTGTYTNSPVGMERYSTGIFAPTSLVPTQRRTGSSSQTASVNADYRPFSSWQHHVTVGRAYTKVSLDPVAPQYYQPYDSLYQFQVARGDRTTFAYNTSVSSRLIGMLSTTTTVGITGSKGEQTQLSGYTRFKDATTLSGLSASNLIDDVTWGGFGNFQLGVFDRLYFTLALRGERNRNYGDAHKVDWTPTYGGAYTLEYGDWSVKLLASYGRATRAPTPSMREEQWTPSDAAYMPASFVQLMSNADLTPEYDRGGQGGVELYYGNLGSIAVNHYRQKVTDLIELIPRDSVLRTNVTTGVSGYQPQYQWVNTNTMRKTGWEGTGSLNLGALSLRGTYFWNDSRVVAVDPSVARYYVLGGVLLGVPSHAGNVTASYARGGTSVTWTTNYVGAVSLNSVFSPEGDALGLVISYSRLRMYLDRGRSMYVESAKPGYAKSDVNFSQRVNRWLTANLNIVNVGNREDNDTDVLYPTLGRQTVIGVTLRWP